MNKFTYKKTFTFLFILFLASCTSAKKSSEVPKIYASSVQYKALNCTELVQESEKLRAVEAGLSQVVDGNYKNQKDIELDIKEKDIASKERIAKISKKENTKSSK